MKKESPGPSPKRHTQLPTKRTNIFSLKARVAPGLPNKDVHRVLIFLGYRLCREDTKSAGQWIKPFGYGAFTYLPETQEVAFIYRTAKKSPSILTRQGILGAKTPQELIELIQSFEASEGRNKFAEKHGFGFITLAEEYPLGG